jgi:hypothetical protein
MIRKAGELEGWKAGELVRDVLSRRTILVCG